MDQELDKQINVVTAQHAEFRAVSAHAPNMAREFGILKDLQSQTGGLQATLIALNSMIVSRRWRPRSRRPQ